jgi:hypothetical protein
VLNGNLAEVRKLTVKPDRAPPTLSEVRAIRVFARSTNDQIAAPEE